MTGQSKFQDLPGDKSAALEAVRNARNALQRGDRQLARRFAEQAVALDPHFEEPWLILAALASPRASLAYLEEALKINPASQRAMAGIDWAKGRLGTPDLSIPISQPVIHLSAAAVTLSEPGSSLPHQAEQQPANVVLFQPQPDQPEPLVLPLDFSQSTPRHTPRTRVPFIFWFAFGTLFFALLFLSAALIPFYPQITVDFPQELTYEIAETVEYLLGQGVGSIPMAPLPIASPVVSTEVAVAPVFPEETPLNPEPSETPYLPFTDTPTPLPSLTPAPTDIPLPSPTLEPSPLPSATLTAPPVDPSPQPTRKPKKKTAVAASPNLRPQNVALNDRWIDVNLSTQTTYAMQGNQVMRSFTVSTGRWPTVTVTGTFKIYVKYRKASMTGDDYYLPNVPYVMYFFKGYGLHGTYWHNSFGTPTSHGCVNLRTEDAAWLFDFAPVGTIVNVHQ